MKSTECPVLYSTQVFLNRVSMEPKGLPVVSKVSETVGAQ